MVGLDGLGQTGGPVPLERRQLRVDPEPVVAPPGGHPEADEAVHGALQRGVPADVVGVGAHAEAEGAGQVDEVDPAPSGCSAKSSPARRSSSTELGPSTEQ